MKPFIIVGMPRVGSSLLALSLAQSPEIKIYGELFHPLESERKGSHFIETESGEVIFYKGGDEDAIEFLLKNIWNEKNKHFKAVGFKLFAEMVQCQGTKYLFERLKKEIENLRIIIIKRLNLLDVFVSREKAIQTEIWCIFLNQKHLLTDYASKIKPIYVDPKILKDFFDLYIQTYQFYERFFKDLPNIQIIYEEMITNYSQTFNKIFDFLGVKAVEIISPLIKQNTQKHQEFIINYLELKEYFKDTPYSKFFNDEN